MTGPMRAHRTRRIDPGSKSHDRLKWSLSAAAGSALLLRRFGATRACAFVAVGVRRGWPDCGFVRADRTTMGRCWLDESGDSSFPVGPMRDHRGWPDRRRTESRSVRKLHVPAAAGCALPAVVAAAFVRRPICLIGWQDLAARPVGVAFRLNAPPESIRGCGAGIWE